VVGLVVMVVMKCNVLEITFYYQIHRHFLINLLTHVLRGKELYQYVSCTYSDDKFQISDMIR
jgi:hypothetical protein